MKKMKKIFWKVFILSLFFHLLNSQQLKQATYQTGSGSNIQANQSTTPGLSSWVELTQFTQGQDSSACLRYNSDGYSNVTCETIYLNNFTFSIPEDGIIEGIQVTITRGAYGGFTIVDGYDIGVYLQTNSSNSTNHASLSDWNGNPSVTYGNSSDYWFNTRPTPQEINDPFFTFLISSRSLCSDTSQGLCNSNCSVPGASRCYLTMNTFQITIYYSFPQPNIEQTTHSEQTTTLAITLGIVIPLFVIITLVGVIIFFLWRRKKTLYQLRNDIYVTFSEEELKKFRESKMLA
jgi:hypothetical protein